MCSSSCALSLSCGEWAWASHVLSVINLFDGYQTAPHSLPRDFFSPPHLGPTRPGLPVRFLTPQQTCRAAKDRRNVAASHSHGGSHSLAASNHVEWAAFRRSSLQHTVPLPITPLSKPDHTWRQRRCCAASPTPGIHLISHTSLAWRRRPLGRNGRSASPFWC